MAWPKPDVELKPIGSAEYSRRKTKRLFVLASPTKLRELAGRLLQGESYETFAAELECHPGYVRHVLIQSGLLTRGDTSGKTARQIARERYAATVHEKHDDIRHDAR